MHEKTKELDFDVNSQHFLDAIYDITRPKNNDLFFKHTVKTIADVFKVKQVIIGIFADPTHTSIRTLSVYSDNDWADNFTYDLKNTPCKDVLDRNIEIISNHASELYPNDDLLVKCNTQSYFGSLLIDKNDEIIGLIALMDTKPISTSLDTLRPLFKIISNCVSLELEFKNKESELRLMASVFAKGAEGVIITDHNNSILKTNPACNKITGFSQSDFANRSPLDLCFEATDKKIYLDSFNSLKESNFSQHEIRYHRQDGSPFPVWQSISAIKDTNGKAKEYIHVFSDITEEKKAKERIYYLAHYDRLTNLINRSSFQECLDKEIIANNKFAILHLDLDNFKHINDIMGRQNADELLIQTSCILNNFLASYPHVISRFSGDEFVMIVKNAKDQMEVENIVLGILEQFSKPIELDTQEISVTCSIGVTIFPEDGQDANILIQNANLAMNQAKLQSGNSYHIFTQSLNERLQEKIRIEKDLRVAISTDEFSLHYQPQVRLSDKKVIGFEALLRWYHPVHGHISPVKFIPVAEESGLIDEIGRWVLNRACLDGTHFAKVSDDIRVSVNVSGRQFTQQDIQAQVLQALSQSSLPANLLEIELTESTIMHNVEESIKSLSKLRELGINIAVDDFGTGYSSMAYLKRFPLDKLKIDRSFIIHIAEELEDEAIVKATVALAHSLKLKVIAEGAEYPDQIKKLRTLGCNAVQGYYYGKPMPLDQAIEFLKTFPNDELVF